ncbi:LiaF transmembrane domain-containing protein [Actinokineospora sp. HUAS TT18]|uniref:LiaF transmembrane domain-containing protein n=1 Tax=Actinokineospora sp. HUAS TT18 TaxID=3447451 RepID=UPI003F523D3F
MKPVRLWIGVVLLVLGTLLALDALDVLDAGTTVGRWWPAALSGLGVVAMLTQGRVSLGPAVVTGLGLILLADTNDWADEDLIGPVLLIVIGVVVLASVGRHRTHDHLSRTPVALFGEAKSTEHGEHFEHSTVSAVFGGATLDLRDAHIDRSATVDAFAFFGGVDVLVPKGWRVSVGGLPIFGGYEDKTSGNGSLPEDAPLLKVNATAVFGAVDVIDTPSGRAAADG